MSFSTENLKINLSPPAYHPSSMPNLVPDWVKRPATAILIPVYNQSVFLENSIKSVLAQRDVIEKSSETFQIYIINDGSTDNKVIQILERYREENGVFIRSHENKGLPLTLEALTRWGNESKNPPELITWHSGDNEYKENAIRTMQNFMIANQDLSLCYANMQLIDEAGKPYTRSGYRHNDQFENDSSIIDLDYPGETLHEYNDNFVGACFLYRSSLDRHLTPYLANHKGFEDYRRWLQLSLLGKISHIKEQNSYYRYRLHLESLTSLVGQSLPLAQKETVERARFISKILDGHYPIQVNSDPSEILTLTPLNEKNSIKYLTIPGTDKFTASLTVLSRSEQSSKSKLPDHLIKSLHNKSRSGFFNYNCLHKSHLGFLNSPPIWFDDRPYTSSFPPSFTVPSYLTRARGKNLGAFGEAVFRRGLVAIFTPHSSTSHSQRISLFIKENPDLGIMLIAGTPEERKVADEIYLATELASNLRITDTRMGAEILDGLNPSLMNALGSVDAVMSICCFNENGNFRDQAFSDTGIHPLTDSIDFCSEAVFAAATGRPLIAPAPEICSVPARTLPHVYTLESLNTLPAFINLAKELNVHSLNATVRAFSGNLRIRQIIASIIIGTEIL
ncbi:MAG TPA: glycosyltransferase family A protein [Oligoflexia bacterium]|nr:glycosyltransferase family A protein [Oligoflexia bacterium]HMP47858.1 glycosyltransferase family A protein [Oligoflexia bacterium]